jgi:hypothetical protein
MRMISALCLSFFSSGPWEARLVKGAGTYLVAYDPLELLVVEDRDGEAPRVLGVIGKVDLAEMGELGVERVGGDVFPGDGLVRRCEAPALQEISRFRISGSGRDEPFSPRCQCTEV